MKMKIMISMRVIMMITVIMIGQEVEAVKKFLKKVKKDRKF